MGHRSIIWLISAFLALANSSVFALGLGKISHTSALNQPLNAKIELFEIKDLTREEIRVKIASHEDFERVGVDKTYFLSDLDFNVVVEGPGAPYVTVRSSKIVREPFLNFLVQVVWPSGKLLREYTLLLDLPTYSGAPVTPVSPSVSEATKSTPVPTSTAAPASSSSNYMPRSVYQDAPSRPAVAPVSPSITEDSYRVKTNDTLWEIAAAVRPDSSVSIHQTMIALQRTNPDAFIRNNINLLKSGKILRIPDRDEIANLNKTTAVREVAQQNSEWSKGSSSEVYDAQLSGSTSYGDDDVDSQPVEGRVSLSSPDDYYDSSEGRASGGNSQASVDALENELAITLEQLDSTSRENSDLRSKVESLEEQIETMERMLEVSSESLRALELAAKKNSQEQEASVDDSESSSDLTDNDGSEQENLEASADDAVVDTGDETDSEATTVETDIDSETADGSDTQTEDDQVASADTQTVPATGTEAAPSAQPTKTPDSKRVVASAQASEKSIVDLLMENIIYVVAGAIALVGLVAGGFFLMRQRSSGEDDFDEFMDQQGFDAADSDETEAVAAIDDEDDIDLGDLDDGDYDDSSSLEDFEPEQGTEQEEVAGAQTEDVVAEADIYIAYGKFDQAEEMLVKALKTDESDEDIRLKLLEVYSSQGDVAKFDKQYSALRAVAAAAAIERAEALRNNIPGAPPFDDSGARDPEDITVIKSMGDEGASSEEDSLDDIDLSLDDESDSDDMSLDLDLGDLDSDGDPDTNLDLELPDDGGSEDMNLDLDIVEDGDDSSLDLDLDLDAGDDELEGLDLALGLDEAESGDKDDDELDLGGLDDDLETGGLNLTDELGGFEIESDESDRVDDDLGDLDLGSDSDDLSVDNLEADLASLDADLGELDADLDLGSSSDFDLEEEEKETENSSVGGDTTINDALSDEFMAQKATEESAFNKSLDIAEGLDDNLSEPDLEAAEGEVDDGEDELDLSTLDQALDELTADLDGVDSDLEVPVTDFEGFDDDLEKDEAMAKAESSGEKLEPEEMSEDSMFQQAIDEVPKADDSGLEFELPEVSPEDVGDDDLDFLSDSDETATKLDLARAYIDMGDQDGARDIIKEVMSEGSDEQKAEAESLMERLKA